MNFCKINYPIRFKAAILKENNKPLLIDDVIFKGPLKKGQVLVRIYYSGICGKQIEEIKATAGKDGYLPHMLGHEGSGVVIDVEAGVKKVKPGDFVVLHWVKGTGIEASTPLYKRNGKRVNAGWITTFNEYGIISENRMTPIPRNSDMKVAALLGCAVTTGVGVILNKAKVKKRESVAVFGCGGVGLNVVQGAKLAGAKPIIVVDKNRKSLKMAVSLGATHAFQLLNNSITHKIKVATLGYGARHVVIAAADPKVIEFAVEASSIPGSVYFVSVPPKGAKITIDPLAIHKKRAFLSSWGGDIIPDKDIPCYLSLHKKGRLKLNSLITKVVSLDNINKGIDFITSGNSGRCMVEMI